MQLLESWGRLQPIIGRAPRGNSGATGAAAGNDFARERTGQLTGCLLFKEQWCLACTQIRPGEAEQAGIWSMRYTKAVRVNGSPFSPSNNNQRPIKPLLHSARIAFTGPDPCTGRKLPPEGSALELCQRPGRPRQVGVAGTCSVAVTAPCAATNARGGRWVAPDTALLGGLIGLWAAKLVLMTMLTMLESAGGCREPSERVTRPCLP